MSVTKYYINGIGIISPQRTFNNSEFLSEISTYHENKLDCVVPDFKEYINPIQLRRLNRMLRVGLSSAIICMRDAKEENADGIITGTGYGFLTDTAKFLTEIYDFNEGQLTPSFFIQSTYNALSGLIALTLKCKGYNTTYVNRGFAFETSLHDAMMHLNANPSHKILTGGYDERDDAQHKIHMRVNYYKQEHIANLQLFEHKTRGTLQGEASAFFLLAGSPSQQTWCELMNMKMIYRPDSEEALIAEVEKFLTVNGYATSDLDVVVSGESGDVKNDALVNGLMNKLFAHTPAVRYKHLSGEYCTASSFGLWLGASMLKKQQMPSIVKSNTVGERYPLKLVLAVNQYMGKNYSLILLRRS